VPVRVICVSITLELINDMRWMGSQADFRPQGGGRGGRGKLLISAGLTGHIGMVWGHWGPVW
jgi:hypothetical protein